MLGILIFGTEIHFCIDEAIILVTTLSVSLGSMGMVFRNAIGSLYKAPRKNGQTNAD